MTTAHCQLFSGTQGKWMASYFVYFLKDVSQSNDTETEH